MLSVGLYRPEVVRPLKALGLELMHVLHPRWPRREPSIVRHDLEPTDGGAAAAPCGATQSPRGHLVIATPFVSDRDPFWPATVCHLFVGGLVYRHRRRIT